MEKSQIKAKIESIERMTFGDVSAWTQRRELRQRKVLEDLWAGKQTKPTPRNEVHWSWDLGLNKIFSFAEEGAGGAQKNIPKEKLR